jgi:hypothetical protein
MAHFYAPFHALWRLGIVPTAREFVDPQNPTRVAVGSLLVPAGGFGVENFANLL